MRSTFIQRTLTAWAMSASTALLALAGEPVYEISRSTFTGGTSAVGGAGGGFELQGGVEPSGPDASSAGGFGLTGGFWFAAPPSDCDDDGSVGILDYISFEACFTGPDSALPGGCECFDVNVDGAVDLGDFAALQGSFTGP